MKSTENQNDESQKNHMQDHQDHQQHDHSKHHEHMIVDFRRRFWISLGFSSRSSFYEP